MAKRGNKQLRRKETRAVAAHRASFAGRLPDVDLPKDFHLTKGQRLLRGGKKALRRFPGGGIGAIGALITAGLLGSDLVGMFKAREKRELLESEPEFTARDALLDMRRNELLALRQGRLARMDPEGYGKLQEALSGNHVPLATGEFVVGGPANPPVGNRSIQQVLDAIS